MNRRVNSITVDLHAALPEGIALCSAIALGSETVPEWVHLLPAGKIETVDGRGPYTADLNALVKEFGTDRRVLDENHSTDLAAPEGRPAPAMGWIVAMQARDDGLWGQVEWTPAGKGLLESKSYRGISPALAVAKGSKRVSGVLRASLVNRPNIKDLISLNQETDVNPLLEKLLKALGLKSDTSEDTLVTAVTALHQQTTAHTTELMAIRKATGVPDDASGETVLAGIAKLKTPATGDAKSVVELQAELVKVSTELNAVRAGVAKDKATTVIDGAIKDGRVGVKALRDHYIERHMASADGAAAVEKEIGSLPKLGGNNMLQPPPAKDGEVSLNSTESAVAKQLGIDPKKFAETKAGTTVVA